MSAGHKEPPAAAKRSRSYDSMSVADAKRQKKMHSAPKPKKEPKGRWTFRSGRKCFVVGKKEYTGTAAYLLYKKQREHGEDGEMASPEASR